MVSQTPNYEAALEVLGWVLEEGRVSDSLRAELEQTQSRLVAAEDVANQLSSVFAERPDVIVLNDVVFPGKDGPISFDHVVCTRRAVHFIDSSSVCDDVEVDQAASWHRRVSDRFLPIPAPLPQLQARGAAFIAMLEQHRHIFLPGGKEAGWQRFCSRWTPYYWVVTAQGRAVDGWRLKTYHNILVGVHRVAGAILQHETTSSTPLLRRLCNCLDPEDRRALSRGGLRRLATVLRRQNEAPVAVKCVAARVRECWPDMPESLRDALDRIVEQATRYPDSQVTATDMLLRLHYCVHCRSEKLTMENDCHGSYRFRCKGCGRSFEVETSCASCGGPAALVRSHRTFFARCVTCGHERVFFVNPSQTGRAGTSAVA